MAESFLFSSTVATVGSVAAAPGAGALAEGALVGWDGAAAGWAATGGVLDLDLQPAISRAAARKGKRILVCLLMPLLLLRDNGGIVQKYALGNETVIQNLSPQRARRTQRKLRILTTRGKQDQIFTAEVAEMSRGRGEKPSGP